MFSDESSFVIKIPSKIYFWIVGVSKGHSVEEIPLLKPMWRLNIKIMPLAKPTVDANLLHATNGGNSQTISALKIDFVGGSTKLRVCASQQPCVTSPVELPVRKFTYVDIQMRPSTNNKWNLIVRANGIERYNNPMNVNPTNLNNIKMYISNPWDTPSNTIMESYQFKSGIVKVYLKLIIDVFGHFLNIEIWFIFYIFFTGFEKGHIIQEFPCLQKTWFLKLIIKPFSDTHTSYVNVLHATIDKDTQNYGERTPAIFLAPLSSKVQVCVPLNGALYCTFSNSLPLNQQSEIIVQQTLQSGQYKLEVKVRGVTISQKVNNDARVFNNVKVYTSNPWIAAANADLLWYEFKNL